MSGYSERVINGFSVTGSVAIFSSGRRTHRLLSPFGFTLCLEAARRERGRWKKISDGYQRVNRGAESVLGRNPIPVLVEFLIESQQLVELACQPARGNRRQLVRAR